MYTIAFVGNPNVGKSAWINALSNAGFKVGNWAGVTVEKKEAYVKWNGLDMYMVDLPGTHSLEETSNEENITATYLKQEHVDVIVNVVDATNLRNNLMLTLMLRELQIPILLLFNFMDEVEKYHIMIDTQKLSRRLQIPIMSYSAFDTSSYIHVKEAILSMLKVDVVYEPLLSSDMEINYVDFYNYVERHTSDAIQKHTLHKVIMGYIRGDKTSTMQLQNWNIDSMMLKQFQTTQSVQQLQLHYQKEIQSLMKYVKEDVHRRYKTTQKIDHIALHRFFGLPLFFVIFTCILLFVFQFSAPWNTFIEFLINDILTRYVSYAIAWMPVVVQEFILKGILAGVGGVLVFIPVMACLNFMMALLEESGYMARISFLLDRFMRIFHLSGKGFVSLMLGFGCNVPAIYATRTLDNEKQKRLSAILIPFMSCGARLPVYVLFASAFFPNQAGLMIISVYGIGVCMALVFALLFSKLSFMNDDAMYIQELGVYRLPNMKVVYQKVKEEVKAYVKKATGIVLWAMMILWVLTYFPSGDMQNSYIARASQFVQPIFEPLGFGSRWESIASLPGGMIAKETIVGYLDQTLSPQREDKQIPPDIKQDSVQIIQNFYTASKQSVISLLQPHVQLKAESSKQVQMIQGLYSDPHAKLRAFSFMVYVLLSIPCIMTLQALYHEYGYKLMLLSIAVMLVVPYSVSLFLFQLFSYIM